MSCVRAMFLYQLLALANAEQFKQLIQSHSDSLTSEEKAAISSAIDDYMARVMEPYEQDQKFFERLFLEFKKD